MPGNNLQWIKCGTCSTLSTSVHGPRGPLVTLRTRRKTQVHLPCFLFFHSGAERPIMFNILWQYTAAILPVSHFSTRNTCSLRYLTPLEGWRVDCKSSTEMLCITCCHCIAVQCQEAKTASMHSHLHSGEGQQHAGDGHRCPKITLRLRPGFEALTHAELISHGGFSPCIWVPQCRRSSRSWDRCCSMSLSVA